MTSRDDDLLAQQVDNTVEMIREFVRQIESGDYGDTWTVYADDGTDLDDVVTAPDEDTAVERFVSDAYKDKSHVVAGARLNVTDEPTVNETSIHDYPLEVVDTRGKPFAVVVAIGGPHIEVVANGWESARLEGYWGGSRVTRYGDYLSTFLDYFIDREEES